MEHAVPNSKHAEHGHHAAATHRPVPEPAPHPIVQWQQQAGNQAMQRLLRTGSIHAKLSISQPGDSEEQEADAVADRIMRSHVGAAAVTAGCSCDGEDDTCDQCRSGQAVARKVSGTGTASPSARRAIHAILSSPGRSLDLGTRAFFESRFGRDFGNVRVHTDASAAASARSIRALAYTAGDHLVFDTGQFAPETDTGRKLLAHELAHVVQGTGSIQRQTEDGDDSTGADQQAEPDQSQDQQTKNQAPVPDQIADSGQPSGQDQPADQDQPAFDMDEAIDEKLQGWDCRQSEQKDSDNADDQTTEAESVDKATVACRERLRLLIESSNPANQAELDKSFDEYRDTAMSEEDTIAALGDPDLQYPEAFPKTWANWLAKHLLAGVGTSEVLQGLQQAEESASDQLRANGDKVPDFVFHHGLPVDFQSSLDLRDFSLANIVGISVRWIALPGGTDVIPDGPLLSFVQDAWTYLRAANQLDFVSLWIEYAENVVQAVSDGDLTVDPQFATKYEQERPHGVSVSEIPIDPSRVTLIPLPPKGRVNPFHMEDYVTALAGLITFGKSYLHAEEVQSHAAEVIGKADAEVASEAPFLHPDRARSWGHEHGFYSDALQQQWEDIKANWKELAVETGKDTVLFTAVQFIPFVNEIVDIYFGIQMLRDAAGMMYDLYAADEEAREATTAAALQRAAAHQATALSSAARNIAQALVQAAAMHAAKLPAKALRDRIGGAGVDTASARAGEGIKGEAANGETPETDRRKAEREPEKREGVLPNERVVASEPTPDGHDVEVTADGKCEICSPEPCPELKDEVTTDLANSAVPAEEQAEIKADLEKVDTIADPAAKAKTALMVRARERVERKLYELLNKNIDPAQELGYNSRDWEQFQRDFHENPVRAQQDLERRLRNAARRSDPKRGVSVDEPPTDAAQTGKGVAHDIGVQRGRQRAAEIGFRPADDWVNPLEFHGPFGNGFDDVLIDSKGNLVIGEYKGGTAELDPGVPGGRPPQMSREWVQNVIGRMRAAGHDHWADRIEAALNNNTLRGRVFSTAIDPITGAVGKTRVVGSFNY
jgi:hypothetical protein